MAAAETAALYRSVLRAAKRFPSRNRLALIEEIQREWREPVRSDEDKGKRLALAADGLSRMKRFDTDASAPSWDVSLAGPTTTG